MDDCICWWDFADHDPEFYFEKDVVAKKSHRCGECGKEIKSGEKYEYVRGKWADGFYVHKTCMVCKQIRNDWFKCGFTFGNLWKDLREHFCEEIGDEQYFTP